MAREITPDDWPARIADAEIAAVVGAPAFGRGRHYAEQGRVANLSVSGNGEILAAAVRGAQGRIYQTMVYARTSGERVKWSGTCSCPVGGNCKHTAALVLTARRLANAASAPPGDADWERRLDQLLHTRQTARRAVAIEVVDTSAAQHGAASRRTGRFGSGSARPGRLHLRPLIAGKRGWVKQGISWRGLTNGDLTGEVAPDMLAALTELAAMDPYGDFYYSNSVIDLGALPARVWGALRRAVAAGVTLMTAQHGGNPVRILPGLRAGLAVTRQPDGTALIAPALDLDGVEGLTLGAGDPGDTRPLGSPTHGYAFTGADGALNLMPLEPPPDEVLGRVLTRNEQLTIPAADVGRFERDHLGRLAAAVPIVDLDPTLTVPDLGTPVAVLHVSMDASKHRAEISWSIRYETASGTSRGEVAVGSLAELVIGPAPGALDLSVGTAQTGHDGAAEAAAVGGTDSGSQTLQAPSARDAQAEDRLARRIIDACTSLAATHGPLWRPGSFTGMGTARLITQAVPALEAIDGVVVEVDGQVPDYREAEDAPLITTDVVEDDDEHPDWFSLRVRVRVGDEDASIERLMTAVATGADEVLLDSGKWINLTDRPEIVRLARLMEEGRDLRDPRSRSGGDLTVTPFQAGLYAELEQLGVIGEAARRWREGVERLLAATAAANGNEVDGVAGAAAGDANGQSSAGIVDAPAPTGLQAELRPYQLDGYRWLALLQSTGLGGILADDMGLGKTLQVLAVVQRMVEQRAAEGAADSPAAGGAQAELYGTAPAAPATADPVLVIAPTSVVGAWAEQAARFCPELRVRTVTRTRGKREVSLEAIRSGADLVVTSYTIARIEEEDFTAVDWAWVVLDEAQFVKNHNAVTYKAVRRLRTPSTVAITGTPLENSLMDLWSLLSIAAPGLLSGPDRFTELYRRPIEHGDDAALAALRARIHPFMLRRTKEDVAADLPAKNEQILAVELPPAHRRAYDRRLARERQKVLGLLEEDTAQSRFTALKSLTILRQMALDPALVEGTDAAGDSPAGKRSKATRKLTAKIEVLLETLQPVVAEGHRALVFSQFTRYLSGVREALEAAGMRTAYLDGTTTNRQQVIDAFRAGDADIFLISLKAGGFGLTLTEADYVFLLDPWWNPQAEEQAVDRTHRIGQDRPVMVYRLVSAGTIEEKVMDLKEKKAELFDRVVEGSADDAADGVAGGAVSGGVAGTRAAASRARLTAQEIRELLGGE